MAAPESGLMGILHSVMVAAKALFLLPCFIAFPGLDAHNQLNYSDNYKCQSCVKEKYHLLIAYFPGNS